jgi:hypothetical protein
MNSSQMKVGVVFPPEATTPVEILRQEIEGVRTHFAGASANLAFAAPEAALATYRSLFPELNIVSVPRKFRADEHVVLLESYHDKDGYSAHWESGDRASQAGATTSSIKFSGRIVPYKRDWSSSELQNMDANIFNQLSPREPWGFYYFPFGYLFRFLGMGPINSFGCRITQSLPDLARRDKNHKVVACFGGSAAWSIFCLHHQMYTELLQQRLNVYCKEQNLELQFTVLNFGQHGHVVMNEMLSYMNFCWDLKPDIVVAHDGYNDAVYGQLCDSRVLDDWDVIYQENLEGWSQILHQTADIPRTQHALPYRAVSQPVRVLRAYAKRKRQFAQIVRSNGGMFVWGLQPASSSHKRRSPLEASLLERNRNPDHAPVAANVDGMFRILRQSLKLDDDTPFVDCDAAMSTCGPDHLMFGDDVHLMPDGDVLLAGLYADAIAKAYVDKGRWRQVLK